MFLAMGAFGAAVRARRPAGVPAIARSPATPGGSASAAQMFARGPSTGGGHRHPDLRQSAFWLRLCAARCRIRNLAAVRSGAAGFCRSFCASPRCLNIQVSHTIALVWLGRSLWRRGRRHSPWASGIRRQIN